MNKRKVVLVGAGNIAKTHASALREVAGTELFGVFDINPKVAESFAKEFGAANVFTTLESAAASAADAVHVLTPPDLHLSTAMPFVEAGKAVLVEKPVGVSTAECDALAAAAQRSGAVIGVNQNLVFNPAYVQLREAITSGRLGRPRYINYVYEAPLRQLTGKQFGHWMFRQPLNILLEQAVHPMSQIVDLAGKVKELVTLAETPVEISPGVGLHNACQVSMLCERMPANLRFHVGSNFTVCRMTVVCDDGVAVADIFSNQFHTLERSAYMEPIDNWLSARATGKQIASQGFAGLRDYALAMVKLRPRSDAFYLGMKGSLQSFYADLQARQRPRIDLSFGAHLVNVCEQVVTAFKPLPPTAVDHPSSAKAAPQGSIVAVLGGTGFIGAHTVAALLRKGYRVRAMGRGAANLQPVFYEPGVEIVRGDVKRKADLERVMAGADFVVNLAHGGGGANFEAIRAAMVDTAVAVADVCRSSNIKRLVHVGSISGLYLGDGGDVITSETPPDPRPYTRNDYSHAKALADAEMLKAHRQGLPVVLLRPGLVVGAGTSPFHGGLGFFNNDQYCVGWNDGGNALPWVLVEDCADAIVSALTSPSAPGKAYNLVGDVRPSARQYLQDLSKVLQRPLHFVPSSPTGLWLTEMGKWAVKKVAGQKVKRPYRRDILSRGLKAGFDCSDAKRDLGWTPASDPHVFHQRALAVHAES
ncbi:NAD-dependent epimerase/dehydratase family protein [Rhodoferax sp. GW822-FHT02A01]|uniref:NAD-dependent epimerase/dehydratase family protein n=1 Tax=Rhodoferax sp. GW822-FHT02A01 TaxID=3141537 RepID=UPI00315D573C